MPTLLVTGPGGAGTSTLAAGLAARAASAGRDTVLLSRRPVVPGNIAGLRVMTVDPQRSFETLWASVGPVLGGSVPSLSVPPASSVIAPPGAGDVALLAELAGVSADLVVVDAGPLDAALALLGLPGALRWWLDQALPTRVRMLGAVRTAAVRSGALRSGPMDDALSAVAVVEQLLSRVRLADPAEVSVRLVASARPQAAGELRAVVPALALHGLRPAAVHARVLPSGGEGDWWAQRAAEQERALADLAELAPLVVVPELPTAPDAVALADLVGDDVAPVPPLPAVTPERVPEGWALTVPLPFARRGELELTRWDDDLVLTVPGARRSLRLDALLRRCTVTGSSLADAGTAAARLAVTFAPDPRQWPAGLLATEGRAG